MTHMHVNDGQQCKQNMHFYWKMTIGSWQKNRRIKKVVPNKWEFALKCDKDNNIERFKARIVVKGRSQVYGVNYTETF